MYKNRHHVFSYEKNLLSRIKTLLESAERKVRKGKKKKTASGMEYAINSMTVLDCPFHFLDTRFFIVSDRRKVAVMLVLINITQSDLPFQSLAN